MRTAPLFFALGDPTRLALVALLSSGGPVSVSRLADRVEVSRQAVSKHLEVLNQVGLVVSRREGRERIWELKPKGLEEARGFLDGIEEQWDGALERLKRWVEE